MDVSTLRQFRAVLEHRRLELLTALARADIEARALAERPGDTGDQSVHTTTRETLFAHADATRRLLRAIGEALIRIRDGTSGECQHCGSETPPARLKVIPWESACIICQEELERATSVHRYARTICHLVVCSTPVRAPRSDQ